MSKGSTNKRNASGAPARPTGATPHYLLTSVHPDNRLRQFVQIIRVLPSGEKQITIQDAQEYRSRKKWLEVANRTGNRKRVTKANTKRQVEQAERRLRKACEDRDVSLLHTFTLKGEVPAPDVLNALRERFTARLSRLGVKPWVAVPEHGTRRGRWHLHVVLREFYDFKLLMRAWTAIAGEAAGHTDWPDKEKAATGEYVPLRAANYLVKQFRNREQGKHRVIFFTASKTSTRVYSASAPEVSYVRAGSK